ncbi:phosphopentomutase [Endozoicomonadaceae bacterium StTr2]
MPNRRAIILVLDSFGIGATADAEKFGDKGADTLGHIAEACADGKADEGRQGPLNLPHLAQLGLLEASRLSTGQYPKGMEPVTATGAWGYAGELSSGKDTPSGHWEMAGVPVLFDWGYFSETENSFPEPLLQALIEEGELPGVLGNCHSSGTEIIAKYGEEHMKTGKPIVYTSADSVFQIAAHEESFGLERLLKLCETARKLLDEYNIGRVIARPFIGSSPEDFKRTGNRRDYAVPPPAATLLDKLVESGGEVVSVGKIADIFAHRGITHKIKATGLDNLFDATMDALRELPEQGLVFTNFVDFDSEYGHRRNVAGYADALERLDRRLPELLAQMQPEDVLIISADHGCDPTWVGTDHTRENIPVLVYGEKVPAGSLGARGTFADIGQSLASWFGIEPLEYGSSFLADV